MSTSRLKRVVQVDTIPGKLPVPATPPVCTSKIVGYKKVPYTVTELQLDGSRNITPGVSYPYGPDGPAVYNYYGGSSGGGGTKTYTLYKTVPVTKVTCVGGSPEIPGTPPKLVVDNGPDWASYARSQQRITGDGVFRLTLAGSALVGFTKAPAKGSYSQGVVLYGAYYTGEAVQVLLAGEVVAEVSGLSGEVDLAIERQSGRLATYVNGAVADSSNIIVEEPLALAAFLETGDAYVDNPSVADYTQVLVSAAAAFTLSSSLVPALAVSVHDSFGLTSYAGGLVDGQLDALVEDSFPLKAETAPTVAGHSTVEGSFGFAAVVSGYGTVVSLHPAAMGMLASDAAYATAELSPAAQTMEAYSTNVDSSVSFTKITMTPHTQGVVAYMITGGVASASLTQRPMVMRASDGPYCDASLSPSAPVLTGFMATGEPLTYVFNETMAFAGAENAARVVDVLAEFDGVSVGDTVSVTLVATEVLAEAIQVSDTFSVSRLLQAMLAERVTFASQRPAVNPEQGGYLITQATGAISRTTGMDYAQFFYVGDVAYGVKRDGVYRLEAGAEEVNAEADFGTTSMGTTRAKSLDAVYLAMHTDGQVYFVTDADGVRRVHTVVQRDDVMRTYPGKGITAREWTFALQIMDATDVRIESFDLLVQASRRWTR